MLTAVSRLANDGGLGCSQPTLAERSNCVVGRLSTSATLASTNPGTVSGVNAAAARFAATEAVVAANNLPPTAAGPVIDNLRGAGTPPPATIGNDTQSGIAAAKRLFTSVRSDWQSVLGGGANGAAASQAARFRNAMNAAQSPADVLLTDTRRHRHRHRPLPRFHGRPHDAEQPRPGRCARQRAGRRHQQRRLEPLRHRLHAV